MQTAFDRAGVWLRKIKSFAHLFILVNFVVFAHMQIMLSLCEG